MKKRFTSIVALILALCVICPHSALMTQAADNSIRSRLAHMKQTDAFVASHGGVVEDTLHDRNGNVLSRSAPARGVRAAAALPSSYDARTKNYITPVKDQNPWGTCWAHSSISVIESYLISRGYGTKDTLDLSEDHLIYFSNTMQESRGDGVVSATSDDYAYNSGGTWRIVTGTLANWWGVEKESNAPYVTGYYPESMRTNSYYHLQETVLLADTHADLVRNLDEIKSAVYEYGGVEVTYYDDGYYYTGTAYYQNEVADSANHAVTIVGWDDNYSRYNFQSSARPSYNGAFLIKNSWGTGMLDNGYMWISYYDPSLRAATLYKCEPASSARYDHVYSYNGAGSDLDFPPLEDLDSLTYANAFVSSGDEKLAAVGLWVMQDDIDYEIRIYRGLSASATNLSSPTPAATVSGNAAHAGYYTIPLDQTLNLNPNERYAVVVSIEAKSHSYIVLPFELYDYVQGYNYSDDGSECDTKTCTFSSNWGESYLFDDEWLDTKTLSNEYGIDFNNAFINVYTQDDDYYLTFSPESMELEVGECQSFSAYSNPPGQNYMFYYDDIDDFCTVWTDESISGFWIEANRVGSGNAYGVMTINGREYRADLQVTAVPNREYTYTVEDGYATITGYSGSASALSVPSTIDGYTVRAIGDSAFKDNTALQSVTLPDTVVSIGNYAFTNCTSITSLTLPNSLKTVGQQAFQNCYGLTSLDIPASVTELGTQSFSDCLSLQSVQFHIGFEPLTLKSFAFLNCIALKTLVIESLNMTIGNKALGYTYTYETGVYGKSGLTIQGHNDSTAYQYYQENSDTVNWKSLDKILESIAVITLPTKTTYFVGETLDTSGMIVKAYYSDDTEYVLQNYNYSPQVLNTPGIQTITVSFAIRGVKKTTTFTVTVLDIELESIAVTKNPTKTTYYVGDTLNTAGMTVTATYNNGSSKTVTGFTCSPTALNTAGTQTVTVSFSEGGKTKTTTFTVTVKPVVPETIAITKQPTKTTYFEGETLNTAGMVVTATYNNGSTKTVTGYTCSPMALNAAGTQMITVSYTEGGVTKTATFTVTVKPVLRSIAVTKLPDKTAYFVGNTLNTAGMVVTAAYSDGSTKTVTGFTCTPTALNTAGTQTITVSFTENNSTKNATFSVTVNPIELDRIAVTKNPTKTTYYVGDKLDTAGMTVTATYNDGSTKTVTGFTCSPTALNTVGTQTITVSFTESGKTKTATFTVTVKPVLQSIAVTKLPDKTAYFVGDALNTAGMVVTAAYSDGSTKTVTGFTCSPTVLNTVGTQTITVSYTEGNRTKTATFGVTVDPVLPEKIEVTTRPNKTAYYVGDVLNTAGMVVTATYNNGSAKTVTGFTCSPTALETVGVVPITVSYTEVGITKTTSFNVTVSPVVLEKIEITKQPSQTTYFIDEPLNTDGMVVTATYSGGGTKDVTASCVYSGFSTAAPGSVTVTVSFTDGGVEKTARFSVTVIPPETAPTFQMGKASASPGQSFRLPVAVRNNPGIVGTALKIYYDPNVLELINAENGGVFPAGAFVPGTDLAAVPYTMQWNSGTQLAASDGTLVNLQFRVKADAAVGTTTAVTLEYVYQDTMDYDLNPIRFMTVGGSVDMIKRTPGDADENGTVTLRDVALISRFLAGGWNVTINESNADVDGSGDVNLRDAVLISRYVAGGWGVVLK